MRTCHRRRETHVLRGHGTVGRRPAVEGLLQRDAPSEGRKRWKDPVSSHFLLVSAGRWAKHLLCAPRIQHPQGDSMSWTAVGVSSLTWPSRLFPPVRAAPGPRARPSSEWFPVRHGHQHFVSGCWGTPGGVPNKDRFSDP